MPLRLTPDKAFMIGNLLTLGMSRNEVAREVGVSPEDVQTFIDGRWSRGHWDPIERDRYLATRKVPIIP